LIENCIYKSTKNIELTQNFDILIWNELNLGVIGKKYKTLQQRKEINTLHDYAKELICKEKISNDIDCPYTWNFEERISINLKQLFLLNLNFFIG